MQAALTVIFLVLLVKLTKTTTLLPAKPPHVRSALLQLSHVNHDNETDNDLTDAQIDHIIKTINRFRAIIQNSNFRSKREALTAASYRKVRYSKGFEAELKFECDDNLNPKYFISDEYTWRRVTETASIQTGYSYEWDPRIQERLVDPFNHSILHAADEADTLRMALSPDVTEIGCFEKTCNGYKFIACKSGQRIDDGSPLNTPGTRCDSNADCTLPGYPRCDKALGLCDLYPFNDSLQRKLGKRCIADIDCTIPGYPQCNTALGICDLPQKQIAPIICYSMASFAIGLSPEKCDGIYETGSDIRQAERIMIPVFINEYRAYVNNNCKLGIGISKPTSNYRKVKYSCTLEMEAKFECMNVEPKTFESDRQTYRYTAFTRLREQRTAIFGRSSPYTWEMSLNPDSQTVQGDYGLFMKLFMSEDVTEVGCFVKQCGRDEYIACKTNHDHKQPYDAPLYTPGRRCNVDADCTLPGYRTCDAAVGLCDYMSRDERRAEAIANTCVDMRNAYVQLKPQKCGPGYDTGSEMGTNERESIVQFINHYRKLVNTVVCSEIWHPQS